MQAGIGFVRDDNYQPTDRLKLVVEAQSETEASALAIFAKRLGLAYDVCSGTVTLEEPAPVVPTGLQVKPDDIEP